MANAALSAHIHALHDPDLRIRIEAGSALVAIGQPAVDPLSASLFNVPPEARWRALAAIGWIGDHQAIEALLTALKDDVWEVRQNAAWALGQISDTRAADSLLSAMRDKDEQVAVLAAYALARMGERRRLESALQDESELARRAASASLSLLDYHDRMKQRQNC